MGLASTASSPPEAAAGANAGQRSSAARSLSISIRAVPSTPNRASAVATTRSSASSTETGDVLRSASWSRACRNPAADTVMSVRADALVGPAPDDPLVVRVAGRRVLDPLLRLLQQGPGLGVGVLGGVARLGGQRPGPAVDLLGARLGGVGHRRGSSRARWLDARQRSLLGLDPLGRGAEVEQGPAEGDRADHEPAEA